MSQVNTDRDVRWNTKFAPKKFDGIQFKKAHGGLFTSEFGADELVKHLKEKGYYTRKELVFVHDNKEKKGIPAHPYATQKPTWLTPGRAAWVVWRSVKKAPGRK